MYCDNDQYTFLEYNPNDNGVIFLLIVTTNSKNSKSSIIIFKRTLKTSVISLLGILLVMTRVKKEL